ncbi:MAG: class II fructose-bisphosphate aldolase [Oscillospiraceae bacterium]|jgi:tagatose 1,6-diphosphate aldolase GatY/KbaY|nr:class II fructose-bisphosphate aldolase [Oscillospiraceae bacterium]
MTDIMSKEKKWAVPALNVENMEMVQGVIEAAEALRAPVIIQTTPGALRHAPPAVFAGMVSALAKTASVPVALHLDHGDTLECVYAALEAGYTSVMYDGSKLPFEENVRTTKYAVSMAGGVPVEGEIGAVGGKEDDSEARPKLTDPEQAAEFARRTGVNALAVAIGTSHGVYTASPKLDAKRLSTIAGMVDVPLVLHGSSGLTDNQTRSCISRGMRKVNVATELRVAFTEAVRLSLAEHERTYDPKIYLRDGREAVKAVTDKWIRVCRAKGKA